MQSQHGCSDHSGELKRPKDVLVYSHMLRAVALCDGLQGKQRRPAPAKRRSL